MLPQDPQPNVYAPPAAGLAPAAPNSWSVWGVLTRAVRTYRSTPFYALVALGLIPALAGLPFEFWQPQGPQNNLVKTTLLFAVYALVVPGQAAAAVTLARETKPTLTHYFQKVRLAPSIFLLWLPMLIGFSSLPYLVPETESETFDGDLTLAALGILLVLLALFVALRLIIAAYALVDRDLGLRDAVGLSWRSTGRNLPRFLGLATLYGLLSFVPLLFAEEGPSFIGFALTILLSPVMELALAHAYVCEASSAEPT